MNRLILLLLLLCFFVYRQLLSSQTNDTIELQFKCVQGEERVDLFIRTAEAAIKSKPEKTISYATRALKLAGELNNQSTAAEAALLLSDGYLRLSKSAKSMISEEPQPV